MKNPKNSSSSAFQSNGGHFTERRHLKRSGMDALKMRMCGVCCVCQSKVMVEQKAMCMCCTHSLPLAHSHTSRAYHIPKCRLRCTLCHKYSDTYASKKFMA